MSNPNQILLRLLLIGYFTFFSHFPLIQIARSQILLQDHKYIYKIANSLQDRQIYKQDPNALARSQMHLKDCKCFCKFAKAF